jgi:hypothetical protein
VEERGKKRKRERGKMACKLIAGLNIKRINFVREISGPDLNSEKLTIMAPFGCADKPAEKHCWLICYERKTLF